MNQRLSTPGELLWRNPLWRFHVLHSGFYSWTNFFLTGALLTIAGGAAVRFYYWIVLRGFVANLPAELRAAERELLFVLPHRIDGAEASALTAQLLALMLLIGILVFAVARSLRYVSRRFTPPVSDEIRVLPLSPRQVVFALVDWPVAKPLLAIAIALVLLSLPGRIGGGREYMIVDEWISKLNPGRFANSLFWDDYSVYAMDRKSWHAGLPWNFTFRTIATCILLFAFHRTFLLIRERTGASRRLVRITWLAWAILFLTHQLLLGIPSWLSAFITVALSVLGAVVLLPLCLRVPVGLLDELERGDRDEKPKNELS